MSDTVFRSQQAESVAPVVEAKSDPSTIAQDTIEVPYLDYEAEHNHPYLVDHFQLGDRWNDAEGGFPKEIQTISNYIEDKIKSGETANSITAIKDLIRGMEKMNNLAKEERPVVRIEVLTHYIEFLQKNDQTRQNLKRYNQV